MNSKAVPWQIIGTFKSRNTNCRCFKLSIGRSCGNMSHHWTVQSVVFVYFYAYE